MTTNVTKFGACFAGRPWRCLVAAFMLTSAALVGGAPPALAQFSQQGLSLVGTGYTGMPNQGTSVAVSADGNTALVGGPGTGSDLGGAWVFARSGSMWTQQGSELVGSGGVAPSRQGWSVALSDDGNTALVGGYDDNSAAGAAWVFTRSGGVWSQQGSKLTAGGDIGTPGFGYSVALSADGNTAIVGGPANDSNNGGAWVFTRSGGSWTQQGSTLVGTGASGAAYQGFSVALSADGNTAIVGGPVDDAGVGTAWVWTRSGSTWTQQGSKLLGNDSQGAADQGTSVALSADGNTAIVGGNQDNGHVGAAWVWTRSGGTWTQQGPKLIGAVYENQSAQSNQGTSVAVSGDGNTAIIGGPLDLGPPSSIEPVGAAWIFTRTSGVWTQQGAKLTANDESGEADFGQSVTLSGDGNTAIVGGPNDASGSGAAWAFATPHFNEPGTHDFNDDGVSDILWRDTSGDLALWLMSAGQMSSGAGVGSVGGSWSVAGTRDFNGDGDADILWLDGSGDLAVWLMNGTSLSSGISLGNVDTQWQVAGTGDFNGDGTGDILWRDGSGDVAIWLMSSGRFSSGVSLGQVGSAWSVAGTGDFNGDGTTDILWHNTTTGDYAIWLMSNGQMSSGVDLGVVGGTWSVVGTGDFNGDGTSDILWRDGSGDLAIWLMSNGQFSSGATIGQVSAQWSVAETGDFNGDGMSDILWLDTGGDLAVWLMNGTSLSSGISLGNVGTAWTVQGQNAD